MSMPTGSRSLTTGRRLPSAPRTCEVARYAGIDMPGTAVQMPGLSPLEKFAGLTRCGTSTLLTSRGVRSTPKGRGEERSSRCFQTIVRAVRRNGSVGEPIWLPCEIGDINHNAALLCSELSHQHGIASAMTPITIFGGQHAPIPIPARAHEEGIRRLGGFFLRDGLVSWDKSALPAAGAAAGQLIIDGSQKTCYEKRPLGFGSMACEFDGKLSVVRWRGQLLLYARANMDRETGARHVQVARSADDGRTWAAFELIRFEGGAGEIKRENNIYYLNAQAINGNLVATFPAYLDGSPGVWLAASDDGVLWSRPTRLLASPLFDSWRTDDHPAGFAPPARSYAVGRKHVRVVAFYVMRGVHVNAAATRSGAHIKAPPLLCRYDFDCSVPAAAPMCNVSHTRATIAAAAAAGGRAGRGGGTTGRRTRRGLQT